MSQPRAWPTSMDIAHVPWVHTGTVGRAQSTEVPPWTLEQLNDTFYGYRYTIDANNPDADCNEWKPGAGRHALDDHGFYFAVHHMQYNLLRHRS